MEDLNKMSPYQLGEIDREEAVKYLILYLSKGTANEKRLAASAIKKLTEKFESACKTAIPFLVENLSDSHPQVRQYTLKSLYKFRLTTSALRVISNMATGDKAEYNRRAAKEILNKQCKC